jgi:hypothetical protein
MTPNLTQEQIFTALRAFIVAVLPSGVTVLKGQANRVPMPASDDFIIMTQTRREQMAQNVHDYRPDDSLEDIARSTSLTFQIDVYGANAAENAQTITTLFRDEYGVTFMRSSGVAPLYCADPQQMPLVAGEQQYIQRWTFGAVVEGIISISVSMQFAANLVTTFTEVH